jgi:hypothetical protein
MCTCRVDLHLKSFWVGGVSKGVFENLVVPRDGFSRILKTFFENPQGLISEAMLAVCPV